jgi:alpha-tubulin suppressor-like RCC1 family protein
VFDGIEEELLNRVKLLFVFRSNEVLFSTINDEVYALGGNEYGCLGTGNDEALSEPTKIYELCENKIIEIVAGHHHMMALTETGKVYTWGRNECGQLGHDEINTDIHKPKIVSDLIRENIISICSGYSHSLALSDNGEIFSWGSNKWGEVGSGKEDLYHLKPIRLKGFGRDKVSVICCGLHHSLALTEKGKVFTWGSGWLRENEISEPRSPKIVRVLNESRDVAIKKIACGKEHCFLLSEHYEIYAFGKNSWDFKNFISEFVPYQQIVKLENYLENISKWEFEEIAASTESNISIGLLFDGTFVIWGEFDECKDKFPRTTKLKSFQDIFLAYSTEKFTYKKYLFNELVIPKEPTDDEIYNSEYKELSTLQSGKYGVVCKAKNIYENSEVYAIKKIPIESKLIEKSIKIIENLSKLKSDFVVNYLKVWIEDNYFIREDSCYFSDDLESCSQYTKVFKLRGSHLLHIQMELCFGTLRFAIDQLKKEIDPETSEMMNKVNYFILCELLTEILEGLNYLHEQDNPITHRYLDPDEILITYGLNGIFIKIADFSCKLIHVDHHEEMIPRKVYRYMAPEIMDLLDKEVVTNSRYYDTKADIYSLGQIMKEMFFHYINDYIRITANEK